MSCLFGLLVFLTEFCTTDCTRVRPSLQSPKRPLEQNHQEECEGLMFTAPLAAGLQPLAVSHAKYQCHWDRSSQSNHRSTPGGTCGKVRCYFWRYLNSQGTEIPSGSRLNRHCCIPLLRCLLTLSASSDPEGTALLCSLCCS